MGGRLLQQFVCDAWASIDQSRLTWAANNQKKLRADLYSGLQDRLAQDNPQQDVGANVGRVILPSSHKGSVRNMQQLLQDSLAICREYRKPDLFLTMTANANWPEITENLLDGQSAQDRPDLVARVFHAKKEALIKKIQSGYFGGLAGKVYTIEFQKRGLPHVHMLIFLEEGDKIRTVEQIDAFISAQFPDPEVHPQLHAAVSKYMLHGPCTPERCMENNVCKKHFPKSFTEQTIIKEDGYPDYARPNNGRTVGKNEVVFDNRHVVPHP